MSSMLVLTSTQGETWPKSTGEFGLRRDTQCQDSAHGDERTGRDKLDIANKLADTHTSYMGFWVSSPGVDSFPGRKDAMPCTTGTTNAATKPTNLSHRRVNDSGP
jgi:hypothetical protein